MNYEKIGKFIAELRKSKDLTQKDLGEKLGLTDRAVSRWERGIGCPDISLLEPLSEALEVSVLEILHGEGIKHNENEVVVNIIKSKNNSIKKWKVISLVFINFILLVLLFAFFVLYLVPLHVSKSGNYMYAIVSPSMKPTLNIYDEVFFETVDIEDVVEGDIILFRTYENEMEYLVVHRVIDIVKTGDGPKLLTKGDANYEQDKEYVGNDNFLGRMTFKIPLLGRYFMNNELENRNFTFVFFVWIAIFSILFLDFLQIRKSFLKKY